MDKRIDYDIVDKIIILSMDITLESADLSEEFENSERFKASQT